MGMASRSFPYLFSFASSPDKEKNTARDVLKLPSLSSLYFSHEKLAIMALWEHFESSGNEERYVLEWHISK